MADSSSNVKTTELNKAYFPSPFFFTTENVAARSSNDNSGITSHWIAGDENAPGNSLQNANESLATHRIGRPDAYLRAREKSLKLSNGKPDFINNFLKNL